jgi:hypothetical protein
VDFESKYIAKQLGLTFNKDISERLKNKETQAFHCFIDVSVKGFNADTSTQAFAKLVQIAQEEGIPIPEITEDKPKKPRSKKQADKPVSVPEVKEYIETDIEQVQKPASVPEVSDFIEGMKDDPIQKTKKTVGPFIKGGLTHDQLTELFNQDHERLQYHPAMIRAYNEIMMKL